MNAISLRPIAITAIVLTALASWACSSTPQQQPDDDSATLTTPQEPTAQELFIQANAALDAGQWEEAIDLYDQVVDTDPQRWDAHMNRGIALTADRQYRPALDAFTAALESGGHDESVVYFNLGNHYQERGMYEAAIDAYRTSMAIDGGLDYDTLLNIGAAFIFLNAYDEARQTIERALELDPDDPRGYISLGVVLHSDGETPEALELYDTLLADHPELAEVHYNRGFILLRTQENEEARQAFETYLRLDPEGPYAEKAQTHLRTLERRQER